MMPSYFLQGWLTSGKSPETMPYYFLHIDAGAWALRAIIEPLVLAFLFSIPANNATEIERKVLLSFEVALIALIAVTLGPTLGSNGMRLSMPDSLHTILFWAWNFGVASYAPLMLGATGFAFKIEARQGALQRKPATKKEPVAITPAKPVQRKKKAKRKATPKSDKEAATLALFNGDPLRNAEIAKALKESPSTTSRRLKTMVETGTLQQTADGFIANGQSINS
jgi:hypothetical protein